MRKKPERCYKTPCTFLRVSYAEVTFSETDESGRCVSCLLASDGVGFSFMVDAYRIIRVWESDVTCFWCDIDSIASAS